MSSELRVNVLRGSTANGNIIIQGEGTSNLGGATMQLQQGLCKAWVRITGTGSPFVNAKSFNTSSVTDNNFGDVTQTLTSAMSDALSNVHASGVKDATTGTAICGPFTITTTTNRVTQGYINATGGVLTLYDYPGFAISQFGDLA